MIKKANRAYLLIFILLFFSGNPLATYAFGKFSTLFQILLILLIVHKNFDIKKEFKKKYLFICSGILLISILQFLEFNFVSFQGVFNLLLKILSGGFIIHYVGSKFTFTLLKVIYHLSIISIFSFTLINVLKFNLPYIAMGPEIKSYFLYGTSYEGHMTKNAGMFWEPGAHAGILSLGLALNFNKLTKLWQTHKKMLFIIVLTLASTQSTTGYIVGFIIIIFHSLHIKKFFYTLFVLPSLLIASIVYYESTDFLKDKIDSQYKQSINQEVGDFSNTRFGSLVFDWHYIQKHPLIGNGLHEKTRYADHQYLFKGSKGDVIGSGNGFSHYLASMGLIFILGYFLMIWRTTKTESLNFSILLLIVILLNLQGEQWLNFPLYLGLPFLRLRNKSIELPQKIKFSDLHHHPSL